MSCLLPEIKRFDEKFTTLCEDQMQFLLVPPTGVSDLRWNLGSKPCTWTSYTNKYSRNQRWREGMDT